MAVKVFLKNYPYNKQNLWLGGQMFREGVAEFKKDAEGIRFAGMFYLNYEVVPVVKGKKVVK